MSAEQRRLARGVGRSVVVGLALVLALACGSTSAYWEGNAFLERGDYPAALAALARAVEEDPSDYCALVDRGVAHERMGLAELAIADYSVAIDLVSHFSFAYYNRGVVLAQMGRDAEAVEDYDQAIEHHNTIVTDPKGRVIRADPAAVYYNRGNSLYRLGRFQESLESLDHAIALSPRFATAYDSRGIVHARLDDREAACRDRAQACELGYKVACEWVEANCK